MEMTLEATTLSIGRLAPGVLAAFLAVDILLRFMPLDPFCFRAWECMIRFKAPNAPFEANRRFHTERAYGNLANIGNLRGFRQYRPQVFTTDRNGFRNQPQVAKEEIDGLLLGDSFVAGDGVSDDETLSTQLSTATGKRFYNAGGDYDYRGVVQVLESRLRLRERRVIVVHQLALPVAGLTVAMGKLQGDWKKELSEKILGGQGGQHVALVKGWWHVSPLQVFLQKGYRLLCDDRILPNESAKLVSIGLLRNGVRTLFYRQTVEALQSPDSPEQVADYFAWLGEAVLKDGFELSVVLVPDKYQIYAPLFAGDISRDNGSKTLLHDVEAALLRRGISTLNLMAVFRDRAKADMDLEEYLYWLDDTHWNRRGIQLAADEINRKWFSRAQ